MAGDRKLRVLTKAQVAAHDAAAGVAVGRDPATAAPQLVVIDGLVLDVGEFLESHPGGPELLEEHLGGDATAAFADDHEHSAAAWGMLKDLAVGVLAGCEKTAGRRSGLLNQDDGGDDAGESSSSSSSSSSSDEDGSGGSSRKLHDGEVVLAGGGTAAGGKHNGLINFKRPVVWQVLKLSEPGKYHDWVETHTTTPDMMIFNTGFLEACSRWPWWYIFILWTPVLLSMGWRGLVKADFAAVPFVANFLGGVFAWSAMEYFLHRFVFHMETKSALGNVVHFFSHGIHHLTPLDTSRLTFPPPFSIMIGVAYYALLRAVFPASAPFEAFYAGTGLMYVLYDTFHFYFHHGSRFQSWAYLQRMKHRHMRHHYHNPNANFGVTSNFWDHIFGTIDDADPKKLS